MDGSVNPVLLPRWTKICWARHPVTLDKSALLSPFENHEFTYSPGLALLRQTKYQRLPDMKVHIDVANLMCGWAPWTVNDAKIM